MQAKIWMQLGLVLGSGRQDLESAHCAFEIAVRWDPGVVLDTELATPAVKAAFATARATVCGDD